MLKGMPGNFMDITDNKLLANLEGLLYTDKFHLYDSITYTNMP